MPPIMEAAMRRVNLYMPDEMYAWLKAKADTEHRSMSAQIVHMLEQLMREER